MVFFRIVAIVAVLFGVSSFATGPARASLLWEFGFVGESNLFSGTGTFTLGGPAGTDGLQAFAYDGDCSEADAGGANVCSFGLGDVVSADWSVKGA